MDFAMIIGAGLTAALTGAFAKSAWPNAGNCKLRHLAVC